MAYTGQISVLYWKGRCNESCPPGFDGSTVFSSDTPQCFRPLKSFQVNDLALAWISLQRLALFGSVTVFKCSYLMIYGCKNNPRLLLAREFWNKRKEFNILHP